MTKHPTLKLISQYESLSTCSYLNQRSKGYRLIKDPKATTATNEKIIKKNAQTKKKCEDIPQIGPPSNLVCIYIFSTLSNVSCPPVELNST